MTASGFDWQALHSIENMGEMGAQFVGIESKISI